MAKRWKYVRAALVEAGYTTTASANGIILDKIEEAVAGSGEYYVYYYDENNDYVRAKYGDTSSPIEVGTDYITFVSATYNLAGTNPYTTAFRVNNDNGNDVTTSIHTTYTGLNTAIATRSGNVLTAVHSGTTVLTATTNGSMTASTSIVVGQFNSVINATVGARQLTANTAYALTSATFAMTNQLNAAVTRSTAKLYYNVTASGTTYNNVELLANSTVNFASGDGTKTLVIYDHYAKLLNPSYTGATFTLTIVG